MEKLESSCPDGRSVKWYNNFWKQFCSFLNGETQTSRATQTLCARGFAHERQKRMPTHRWASGRPQQHGLPQPPVEASRCHQPMPNVIHLCKAMSFSNKNKLISGTHHIRDEFWKHCAKWKQPAANTDIIYARLCKILKNYKLIKKGRGMWLLSPGGESGTHYK